MHDAQINQSRFKNRNRLGIVANILTIAKTGALKTHLMYKANLSYTMLRDYLKFLRDSELLEESHYPDQKVTLYKTTEKDLRFLASYLELKDLATPLADKMSSVASGDLAKAIPSSSQPDMDQILR